jgi:ATP-binding cassette subfamily B protein
MFKLFKRYLKFYKLETILAPIFKLFEAVFALIVPLIVANIIDYGINGDAGQDYIIQQGLILLALALIGFASTMVCQILSIRTSTGYGYKVRTDLYNKINSFSLKEFNKFGSSSLQTRLTSDIVITQTGMALLLRLAVRAPFLIIGAIVMSFFVDSKLAIIFTITGVVLGVVIYFVSKASVPFNKKIQGKLDEITTSTKDNLSGARVVRAFNREDYEREKFNKIAEELQGTSKKLAKISSLLNPLNSIIVNTGIIAVIYYGGLGVNLGNLTQGDIVALVNYMTQISLAIVVVSNLVVAFSRASSSSNRISEVLDTRPTIESGEYEPEFNDNAIKFKNVNFRYSPNAELALSNINLDIKKGQTIGIIGGTGSGKSTLINLIERYYDVTGGSVLLNDVEISKYNLNYLRKNIGLVPQGATLFSGTIRSNISFGNPEADEKDIEEALDISQAKEFVKASVKGLDTHVVQGGKNFSGGQRQRLTIARAIAKKPKILILDDSSSALDFQTDFNLRQAIKEKLGPNVTTIMITQRVSSIKYADSIVVLDKGQVVGQGKHDKLLKDCSVYQEICTSQRIREDK